MMSTPQAGLLSVRFKGSTGNRPKSIHFTKQMVSSTSGIWLIQERSLRDGGEKDTIKEHKETSCQGRKTISKDTGKCTPREHKVRGQPGHTLTDFLCNKAQKTLADLQKLACNVSPSVHAAFAVVSCHWVLLWTALTTQHFAQGPTTTHVDVQILVSGTASSPKNRYDGCSIRDFEQGPILGTGSFGRVLLVHTKAEREVCAIKALSKAHLVKNQQVRLLHS